MRTKLHESVPVLSAHPVSSLRCISTMNCMRVFLPPLVLAFVFAYFCKNPPKKLLLMTPPCTHVQYTPPNLLPRCCRLSYSVTQ